MSKGGRDADEAAESTDSLLKRLERELSRGVHEPVMRDVSGGLVADAPASPAPGDPPSDPDAVAWFGPASVHVALDPATRRHNYVVTEPELTGPEERLLAFVKDTLRRTLRGGPDDDSPAARKAFLLARAHDVLARFGVEASAETRERLDYFLARDLLGYDRIHVLMLDPDIEDVSCDGPGIPVFVYHRKHGSLRTNVAFDDDATLDAFVTRLAERSGKHISVADPVLDATLPDRSRLQATLAREVTTRGSSFTVRRFRDVPVSVAELIHFGTVSAEIAAYWWLAVEEGMSAIVAGGTASGKTTLLNAVSMFIPPDRKIVSIEDTREINIPHENWIAGVTRQGYGDSHEGVRTGAIDTFQLLQSALRQRPEYILVGEVRGREAFTLFQAMATGHATYATMHADSALSAVRRLENEPIGIPRIMLGSLDVVAVQHATRYQGRAVRRVKEIVEFVGMDADSGELLTNTLFRWDPRTDSFLHAPKSYVIERAAQQRGLPLSDLMAEWQRRADLLRAVEGSGARSNDDVANVVAAYYADPAGTLERALARVEGDA